MAETVQNPFLAWRAKYLYDPQSYVREVLGAIPEPWQDDVLAAYRRGLQGDALGRRIAIRSGHGVGKSAVLSWIASHHQYVVFPQKTAITAPSKNQLWDALWPELRSWIAKMPPDLRGLVEIKAERIELKEATADSFITAKVARADQPEALQGVHAEHVLLILDEASGVPDAVIDAASGSMSGSGTIMIMAGNPLHSRGYFYDSFHRMADRWTRFKVSVFDSKYSGGKEYAEEIEARYGKDSNQYRVRVMGEFPLADDDVVIPFDLVESAVGRDVIASATVAPVWGLDVAAGGTNRTALVKRHDNVLLEPPKTWGGLDDAQVAGRVKHEWDMTPEAERPSDINVDAIGYGSAVVTRLRELGLPANAINVSETPSLEAAIYRNLRVELYFKGRKWFATRAVRLPPLDAGHLIEDLMYELTTQTYGPQPVSGKLIMHPKTGHKSPDLADAFILTFATDSVTIAGARGGRWQTRPALSNPVPGLV